MSTSGERCAYFEGLAYLLDFRCFFAGRGDDVTGAGSEGSVLIKVAVRERFVDVADAVVVAGETFSLVKRSAYEYFANRPLNDAGGGEERVSGGSESSLSLDGIVSTTVSIRFERVCGIL